MKSFYSDVSSAQPVSEQELGQHMQQLSAAHQGHFDNLAALKELYIYVTKYHELVSGPLARGRKKPLLLVLVSLSPRSLTLSRGNFGSEAT